MEALLAGNKANLVDKANTKPIAINDAETEAGFR